MKRRRLSEARTQNSDQIFFHVLLTALLTGNTILLIL
jgi:hypothetical protein